MKKTKNSAVNKNNGAELDSPLSQAQIADAKTALSLAQGWTLTQAVQFALASDYGPVHLSLREALPAFMVSKAACDAKYQAALFSDLQRFVNVLPETCIYVIQPKTINDYLSAQGAFQDVHSPWSQQRKSSVLRHLSAFFGWAAANRYCPLNPAARLHVSPPPHPQSRS